MDGPFDNVAERLKVPVGILCQDFSSENADVAMSILSDSFFRGHDHEFYFFGSNLKGMILPDASGSDVVPMAKVSSLDPRVITEPTAYAASTKEAAEMQDAPILLVVIIMECALADDIIGIGDFLRTHLISDGTVIFLNKNVYNTVCTYDKPHMYETTLCSYLHPFSPQDSKYYVNTNLANPPLVYHYLPTACDMNMGELNKRAAKFCVIFTKKECVDRLYDDAALEKQLFCYTYGEATRVFRVPNSEQVLEWLKARAKELHENPARRFKNVDWIFQPQTASYNDYVNPATPIVRKRSADEMLADILKM